MKNNAKKEAEARKAAIEKDEDEIPVGVPHAAGLFFNDDGKKGAELTDALDPFSGMTDGFTDHEFNGSIEPVNEEEPNLFDAIEKFNEFAAISNSNLLKLLGDYQKYAGLPEDIARSVIEAETRFRNTVKFILKKGGII